MGTHRIERLTRWVVVGRDHDGREWLACAPDTLPEAIESRDEMRQFAKRRYPENVYVLRPVVMTLKLKRARRRKTPAKGEG